MDSMLTLGLHSNVWLDPSTIREWISAALNRWAMDDHKSNSIRGGYYVNAHRLDSAWTEAIYSKGGHDAWIRLSEKHANHVPQLSPLFMVHFIVLWAFKYNGQVKGDKKYIRRIQPSHGEEAQQRGQRVFKFLSFSIIGCIISEKLIWSLSP